MKALVWRQTARGRRQRLPRAARTAWCRQLVSPPVALVLATGRWRRQRGRRQRGRQERCQQGRRQRLPRTARSAWCGQLVSPPVALVLATGPLSTARAQLPVWQSRASRPAWTLGEHERWWAAIQRAPRSSRPLPARCLWLAAPHAPTLRRPRAATAALEAGERMRERHPAGAWRSRQGAA